MPQTAPSDLSVSASAGTRSPLRRQHSLNPEARPPHQVEFHVRCYQKSLLDFCTSHAILLQAYAPLGSPLGVAANTQDATVTALATRLDKTPAQILLRWAVQHCGAAVVGSGDAGHMKSNLEVLDFELSRDDMTALDGVSRHGRLCQRFCWDPSGVC